MQGIKGTSGFFGFTFSGIYKEVQKKYGKTTDGYLRATRMAQGYLECARASQEECEGLLWRWEEVWLKEGKGKNKKVEKKKVQNEK